MPDSYKFLFDAVLFHLYQTPYYLLGDLALQLRVSRRTLENCIHLCAGKRFRDLRQEILLTKVKNLLASNPTISVKELSFAVGFKSASSFSRAIKRACGSYPAELRSHALHESNDFVITPS